MMKDNEQLININDLSRYLNVSTTTVYRLVESRKIPFYKIMGSIRFDKKDVLKFLEDSKIEPIKYQ